MIESSKYNRENYPREHFWTQEREIGVKFNPGLSANRPSNNRAGMFSQAICQWRSTGTSITESPRV